MIKIQTKKQAYATYLEEASVCKFTGNKLGSSSKMIFQGAIRQAKEGFMRLRSTTKKRRKLK